MDRDKVVDRMLRIQHVADQLAVSRITVYRLIERGELQSVRVMSDQRIPAQSVADYINRICGKGA